MHLCDPTFPEIRRPIGYMPDTEYQLRAVRIYLAFLRAPDTHPDYKKGRFSIAARNLALAWESALFMGEY